MNLTFERRFWAKVRKGPGCWGWSGHVNEHGYGRMMWDHDEGRCKLMLAPGASWMIHFGTIPVGKLVLHRCDHPACTKPEHLYLGTQRDNMRDRAERTWRPSGELHPRATLKNADIPEIRKLLAIGTNTRLIAAQFGVKRTAILDISCGKSWKCVP